jgi:aminoglycoside phosphotransferase (APT) family kinase protein
MEVPDWRARPTEAQIERIRRRFPTEAAIDASLTKKMRQRGVGRAHTPQTPETVRASLEAFLRKRIDGPVRVQNVAILSGGSSKEQFAFELLQGAGAPRKLVLRLETPESTVQTNRLREFQVLAAAHGKVPAPKPFWVDVEGTELPQPGLIYEFKHGVSRPPDGAKTAGPQQGYNERYIRLLGPQFVNLLADIARIDWSQSDHSAFQVPTAGTNEAPLMGVDWWERVWEEDRYEANPMMSRIAGWLRENAPTADHICFVHGDYRTGQFLFDVETAEITAVLDWEMVRLGDYHEDLTYNMLRSLGSADRSGRQLISGFYPVEEYFESYERRSGLKVDPRRVTYYRIFNLYKLCVIGLATSHRCILSRKTHNDTLMGLSAMMGAVNFHELQQEMEKVI